MFENFPLPKDYYLNKTARLGDAEGFKYYLNVEGLDPTNWDHLPLRFALKHNHHEILKVLARWYIDNNMLDSLVELKHIISEYPVEVRNLNSFDKYLSEAATDNSNLLESPNCGSRL